MWHSKNLFCKAVSGYWKMTKNGVIFYHTSPISLLQGSCSFTETYVTLQLKPALSLHASPPRWVIHSPSHRIQYMLHLSNRELKMPLCLILSSTVIVMISSNYCFTLTSRLRISLWSWCWNSRNFSIVSFWFILGPKKYVVKAEFTPWN
jgi:hypothetical protein